MTDHVALPHCRHRRTAAGPHQTRVCCVCDANLGHAGHEAYWQEVDGQDAEPEPEVIYAVEC